MHILSKSLNKEDFDKAKCMYFLIKDENVFDKYGETWEKVSYITKKKFNRELRHYKIFIKVEKNQHKRNLLLYFETSNTD